MMLILNAAAGELSSFEEFYQGKSVFLTGAAGFIGSVLLEILLRCCPGIKCIYTLLRSKKNIQAENRKEQIFSKKIFAKLKKENPGLLGKVRVISGDVSLPNLGMNEESTHLVLQEVSIVFHCAAVTNFEKPMEFLLKNNVVGLNSVIELCRKMRKFDVLVYTSTAYSNSNHLDFPLKEEVYRLPFDSRLFLDALINGDNHNLQKLIHHCKPDWPNSYCFSKCLAENVIMDTASDLPVAILRPSKVIYTWKHPIPGYAEDSLGIMKVSLGVGKGFIKVSYGDPNCKINLVPVDIVANAHVVAAWSVGTKRCASPLVAHCTALENLEVTTRKFSESFKKVCLKFPLPLSFQECTYYTLVPYKYIYFLFVAYYHYLPAIILDVVSIILGSKYRLFSLYRKVDRLNFAMSFFLLHPFEFEMSNFKNLDNLIQSAGIKDLSLDFSQATVLGMLFSLPEGSSFYDWSIDKKSPEERQRIKYKRHLLILCIQGTFLLICCLPIFWVFFSLIPSMFSSSMHKTVPL